MAACYEASEKQHLLPHFTHCQNGYLSAKCSLSNDALGSSSSRSGSQRSLSLRTRVILAMIALPAYLLASAALSSIRSLMAHDGISPYPDSSSQYSNGPDDLSISSAFGSVAGPLVSTDFPDPAIIHIDGISYAFATGTRTESGELIRVQVATSKDNQTWTLLDNHEALPQVAAWETGGSVWAPDVIQLDDGSFVLYYCDGVSSSPGHHCVGAATSDSILGPYQPLDYPLACPDVDSHGGAIDPDGFEDPSTGRRYVVYKIDGNSLGHGGSCNNGVRPFLPTPIILQEVDRFDGITPVGKPVQILDRDALDGPLVEAPSLHRSAEGIYFLFYSSQCFTTPLYNVGYATSTDIRGPYTRSARPLLVTSDADLVGPGGLDIVHGGGGLVVFHGHLTADNNPLSRNELEMGITTTRPFMRGMWSARATFHGREVSLS